MSYEFLHCSSKEVCFGTCLLLGIHLRTIPSSPKVYAAPNSETHPELIPRARQTPQEAAINVRPPR